MIVQHQWIPCQKQDRPIRVKISTSDGKELVNVPQQDLFGKNGWPAEEKITTALQKFKEETEGAAA